MTEVYLSDDPALVVIERAATDLAVRFGRWTTFEDLYQEGWVLRLSHPLTVDQLLPTPRDLERFVRDHLLLVARREKAASSGYSVDDEAYYTPAKVAELLPLTLDIEAALLSSAPADDGTGGRVRNPHSQGDMIVSLLDVRKAWVSCPFRNDEARLIEARFCDGMDYEHIAGSFEMPLEDVKKHIAIGLRRMVTYLGGWPGRACPADCPDCIERTEAP